MTKELKTNMISADAEKTQCLLLCGLFLATCSRGWVQHRRNDPGPCRILFVFSLNPEMLIVCTGKRIQTNKQFSS